MSTGRDHHNIVVSFRPGFAVAAVDGKSVEVDMAPIGGDVEEAFVFFRDADGVETRIVLWRAQDLKGQ